MLNVKGKRVMRNPYNNKVSPRVKLPNNIESKSRQQNMSRTLQNSPDSNFYNRTLQPNNFYHRSSEKTFNMILPQTNKRDNIRQSAVFDLHEHKQFNQYGNLEVRKEISHNNQVQFKDDNFSCKADMEEKRIKQASIKLDKTEMSM